MVIFVAPFKPKFKFVATFYSGIRDGNHCVQTDRHMDVLRITGTALLESPMRLSTNTAVLNLKNVHSQSLFRLWKKYENSPSISYVRK
jgi:hypothetical protein